MWAAVCNGDPKKVAELMRQDPGFNVNEQDGNQSEITIEKKTEKPVLVFSLYPLSFWRKMGKKRKNR